MVRQTLMCRVADDADALRHRFHAAARDIHLKYSHNASGFRFDDTAIRKSAVRFAHCDDSRRIECRAHAASMATVTCCYKSVVHLKVRIGSTVSGVCSVAHRFHRRTPADAVLRALADRRLRREPITLNLETLFEEIS